MMPCVTRGRGGGWGGRGTLRREREGVAADVRLRLAAPPCLHPLRWLQYSGTTAEALFAWRRGSDPTGCGQEPGTRDAVTGEEPDPGRPVRAVPWPVVESGRQAHYQLGPVRLSC